jgi:hypothetical protein
MNIATALRELIDAMDPQLTIDARAALAAHDAAVQAGEWYAGRRAGYSSVETAEEVIAQVYGAAYAVRIVACVNACQGIADPALMVAAAHDAANCGCAACREVLQEALT